MIRSFLSLCGDAFCAGKMRRKELSGSVQCSGRFVKHRGIGLEDVGHPRGDAERDLDVGGGGFSCQANGVVEENLVTSGLGARAALSPTWSCSAHGRVPRSGCTPIWSFPTSRAASVSRSSVTHKSDAAG